MLNINRQQKHKKNKVILGLLLLLCVGGALFIILSKVNGKKQDVKTLKPRHSNTSIMNKRESIIPRNTNKNESGGQYTPWTDKRTDGTKIAYLTFDDGPSVNTEKILQILNSNNIKASFFLIGKNAENNTNLVKEEVANGEVVGNHTYSHQLNYKEGPAIFVNDINRCQDILKSILGPSYKLKLVRFPGGSFGPKILPFRDAVAKAGYRFIDWNDEIGDADGYDLPIPILLNNLKKYTVENTVVILMHDAGAKTTTVQALPQIIQYLKSKGYSFDTLQ
jgi:peptidoglycan/xylan/chitin deacetylase (PgdA/CDA1 family)